MSRARRESSAFASAPVSVAMSESGGPPAAVFPLRAMARSLRRQQACGLGARLVGDLRPGQHAGNLLAPLGALQMVEAGDDAQRLVAVARQAGRGALGDQEMAGGPRGDLRRMGDGEDLQTAREAG